MGLGGVWEGFGEDLGRKKEEKKRVKKKDGKKREKRGYHRRNSQVLLFGATCIRGDCLGSLPF